MKRKQRIALGAAVMEAAAYTGGLEAQVIELKRLVVKGFEVVEDFMPNIGACALQNYGRLNEFLLEARPLKHELAKQVQP